LRRALSDCAKHECSAIYLLRARRSHSSASDAVGARSQWRHCDRPNPARSAPRRSCAIAQGICPNKGTRASNGSPPRWARRRTFLALTCAYSAIRDRACGPTAALRVATVGEGIGEGVRARRSCRASMPGWDIARGRRGVVRPVSEDRKTAKVDARKSRPGPRIHTREWFLARNRGARRGACCQARTTGRAGAVRTASDLGGSARRSRRAEGPDARVRRPGRRLNPVAVVEAVATKLAAFALPSRQSASPAAEPCVIFVSPALRHPFPATAVSAPGQDRTGSHSTHNQVLSRDIRRRP
jgi:hypothetical protein